MVHVAADAQHPVLEVHGVVKRFGGLAAVDGVDFEVARGETFGIAGPNGAGKTTLFDVITGISRATEGRVVFEGHEVQHASVQRICHLGLARTFQLPSVFDSQTALSNVLAGSQFGGGRGWWHASRRSRERLDRARAELDFVGLGGKAAALGGPMPVFDKKRVMIASALATEPSMLFLDEPFGGLSPPEVDELLRLLRRVRERAITIVLIEHVMRALMDLSDRVLIMNHGRTLFLGAPADVLADEEVVRVYLGRGSAKDRGGEVA
ncbi:MAG: Branched-chain amino acid transport ATP-binding protein LivG [uncultured Nocardioidaceae bacterium]|uniref:Branched-chain amino acid transport ATP-binding protein LivG n=1 Tax=uncultured Nocardioidaceae bacterium TaxID=253824 RepID=A0A6J4LT47_9ACTN|nr:MAG: Branched-chain amino acid transport ATP-binding protein LivG [uncultured Nocardioidaceae bacterium]